MHSRLPRVGEISANLHGDAAVLRDVAAQLEKSATLSKVQDRRIAILQDFVRGVKDAHDACWFGMGLQRQIFELLLDTTFLLNEDKNGQINAGSAQQKPDDA
jgi:hypothetical protein